jgi:hypothetical protein
MNTHTVNRRAVVLREDRERACDLDEKRRGHKLASPDAEAVARWIISGKYKRPRWLGEIERDYTRDLLDALKVTAYAFAKCRESAFDEGCGESIRLRGVDKENAELKAYIGQLNKRILKLSGIDP